MEIKNTEIDLKEIITNGAIDELLKLDIDDDLKFKLSLKLGKILKNI